MRKVALITGASGFVGFHLANELRNNGYNVVLTDRVCPAGGNLPQTEYAKMDILNYEEVRSVINLYKPTAIFHLAAIAFVPSSWQDPGLTIDVNTKGTLHILDAVRSVQIDPVIQVAGSSEEYGLVLPEETPISETNPLRPLSPYAVSKIAADFLCYQYFKSYGLKTIRTRAFNHTGPGRGEAYMTSTFAKQIVECELGLREMIEHGDLTSIRDLTDVRDTVRAYRLLVEKGEPGEVYNIGTGVGHTADEVLMTLVHLSEVKGLQAKADPARMRPSDVKILVADATKLKDATGWEPSYTFEQTMADLLQYWRDKLNK